MHACLELSRVFFYPRPLWRERSNSVKVWQRSLTKTYKYA